jgi:hypothetical protein
MAGPPARDDDGLNQLPAYLRGLALSFSNYLETIAFTCHSWPAVAPIDLGWKDSVPGEGHLGTWNYVAADAIGADEHVRPLVSALRSVNAVRLFLYNPGPSPAFQCVLVPAGK